MSREFLLIAGRRRLRRPDELSLEGGQQYEPELDRSNQEF